MPRLKLRLVRGLGHRIRISMGRSDVYLGHADITAVILNGMPLDPSGYPTNRCVTYWCFVQTFRWYRASGDMELHERALSNLINARCRHSDRVPELMLRTEPLAWVGALRAMRALLYGRIARRGCARS